MKKNNKILSFVVIIALFMVAITPIKIFATGNFTKDAVDVDVNKVWTINFNNELDRTSIDKTDNITVVDDKGSKIGMKIDYKDNKSITVSPLIKYNYGKTYTLIVKDNIKSKQGSKLKKGVEMKFTTKDEQGIKNIDDITAILYRNEKYELPSVVKATMIDNSQKNVSIKWNGTYVDTSKSGTYNYKGSVVGYDKNINLKVIVKNATYVDLSNINKVCIDPYSASNFKSLVGATGIKDDEVNLNIALKVGELLEQKGIKVCYTRKSDSVSWNESEDVSKRVGIANESGSELLISIRSNYYTSQSVEGIETYYLDTDSESKTLASTIQKNVVSQTQSKDREIKIVSNTHRKVLEDFNGIGVLVYAGFISNPKEEGLLGNSQYQDKIAKGIAESISRPQESQTISSVKDITQNVEAGSSYKLPTNVEALNISGEKIQTPVIWEVDTVNTANEGTYKIKGRVKNYSDLIMLTVVVTPKKAAKYKVCIDPGHGGYDSGAVGPGGTKEKDIALKVSLKVGAILTKNGIDVIYTRTSDKCPWPAEKSAELKMRCEISDKAKANYFVSIHENSVDGSPSTSGIETLYGANRTDGIPLAKNIQAEMVAKTGGKNRGIKKRNDVFVIKWPDAHPALVELEFLSNPEKERLLNTSEYQQKCAEAIAAGIMKTLK